MKKKYKLLLEHKAQFESYTQKWIDNALNTNPMSDLDREKTVKAIKGMYTAADLAPPKNIVFVPSPAVLRFASGFAALIWHFRHSTATHDATYAATDTATYAATDTATDAATADATDAATRAATADATRAATHAATYDATDAATYDATYDATHAATIAATHDATHAATRAATRDATIAATADATDAATYDATRDATIAATREATDIEMWYKWDLEGMGRAAKRFFGKGWKIGLETAANSYKLYNGGNQWSGWCSFLSFFKDVVDLKLPEYETYKWYEQACLHSGPRMMHKDFCMVSDRPIFIKMDAQNRPHCTDGPFTKWRDGFALYSLHGVRVPAKYIEKPVDPMELLKESNAQVRMAVIRKEGFGKFIDALGGKLIDEKSSTRGSSKPCQLWEIDMPEIGTLRLLKVTWFDTVREQETFLPVPTTKQEFKDTFGVVPSDPNNAELVRLATMKVDTSKYEIVSEK